MLLVQFQQTDSPKAIELLSSIGCVAPVAVTNHNLDAILLMKLKSVWVISDDVAQTVQLLDKGADVVIIAYQAINGKSLEEVAAEFLDVPSQRLSLQVSIEELGGLDARTLAIFHNIILTDCCDISVAAKYPSNTILLKCPQSEHAATESLVKSGQNCMIKLDFSLETEAILSMWVELYLAPVRSDRSDGLYPTVVVDEQKVCLGLCYSSSKSISESLRTRTGVYFSRSRGLWYKGASSGATQKLIAIDLDCDADAFCFTVIQKPPGFCHLNTRTCFGDSQGLSSLYHTLVQRFNTAPEKSYTKRLFTDPELLNSKIMEEADELCTANGMEEIAWEAADLLYFALVRCVAAGVSLSDVEHNLNKKSKKITRRKGDAKPKQPVLVSENAIAIDAVEDVTQVPYTMRVYDRKSLKTGQHEKLLMRPIINTGEIMDRVKPIVAEVRSKGDEALKNFTSQFDKVQLTEVVLRAPFPASAMLISEKVKKAIDLAYDNVEKFHIAQLDDKPLVVETMPGVTCTRFLRPIERVGLYVPGGTAILPSSTLMLGVPAKVAGCKQIIIATPPKPDGSVPAEVVYVAHKVGAALILKAGGAQAVAAMAYGTESVPKVDKICGPGNQYVTAAKMVAQADTSALVSIDMPAGPSELLVIADHASNPAYVVSDLLSQAEHGTDSQVVLVAVGMDNAGIQSIQNELFKQASVLPRASIVKVSLTKSFILQVANMQEAMAFSNEYAPEHLILNVLNAATYIDNVMNAGSVFVGPYSPESCGDYASGTNHTLPTYGYSRMYSGVNTHTFVKHITSQELTAEGLDAIGDCVTTLAEVEGLEAHRNAVALRLADIRK